MKFMKLIWSIALLTGFITIPDLCLAKDMEPLSLQLKPCNVADQRFYIKEVIDARDGNPGTTGYIPVKITGDFDKTLSFWLGLTYQKAETKVPLVLKVTVLEISDRAKTSFACAKAKIGFYLEKNGQLAKVGQTEEILIDCEGSYTDEALFRAIVEKCMKAFATSDWEKTNLVWQKYQQVKEVRNLQDAEFANPPIWHKSLHCDLGNRVMVNVGNFEYIQVDPKTVKLSKAYFEILLDDDVCYIFGGGDHETLHRFGRSNWFYSLNCYMPIGFYTEKGGRDGFLIGLKMEQGIGLLLNKKNGSMGMIFLKLFENNWWGHAPDTGGIKLGFSIPLS